MLNYGCSVVATGTASFEVFQSPGLLGPSGMFNVSSVQMGLDISSTVGLDWGTLRGLPFNLHRGSPTTLM